MQTEFIRSLNCNYERILLEEKPEDRKYRYCMLGRGGIKGLLTCSLRYVNGVGYLYYDISSKQNFKQRYSHKCISREDLLDFIWNYSRIQQEMERFLLDVTDILWYPEQIYQDIESCEYFFLYVPYYEGDNGFKALVEYWVERMDYNDDELVECVYRVYEQLDKHGEVYLQSQIIEDINRLEKSKADEKRETVQPVDNLYVTDDEPQKGNITDLPTQESKRKIFSFWDSRKKKNKDAREAFLGELREEMLGTAVAEETVYDEEYGKTIYIEAAELKTRQRALVSSNGMTIKVLEGEETTLGKKKGEVDVELDDASVSRVHARIVREQEDFYIEDLNSTNGTYKNGLRLQPYERRKLNEGDEITLGRVVLRFD